MHPNQCVVGSATRQQYSQRCSKSLLYPRGRLALFRKIAEGRLDEPSDWRARELLFKQNPPVFIGLFTRSQRDFFDRSAEVAHELRGGEFDEASDATWPQGIM